MRESTRDNLLNLAYTLAPELHRRPLYIVTAGELVLTPTARGCGGVTNPGMDLACRDAIGPRWRGRGWCMVLARDEDMEGTFLHELAHILDQTMPWCELGTLSPDLVASVIRDDLKQTFTDYVKPQKYIDWAHGIEFHRALIHLHHRLACLDLSFGWHEMSPRSRCPMFMLAHALGAELRKRRHQHFADFMARPLPRRFRKLWNRRHVAAERTLP